MKILSLDMSTKKTGYAIFNNSTLSRYDLISEDNKDMETRIWNMAHKIEEIIKQESIKHVIVEDVPISITTNLQTAKCLILLQGYLKYMCASNDADIKFYKPTEWRKLICINRTAYICNHCKNKLIFNSNVKTIKCNVCENDRLSKFDKKTLNSRQELKERAVEMVNELYGLELKYFDHDTKKNISQDDIAEAILIGTTYIKERMTE